MMLMLFGINKRDDSGMSNGTKKKHETVKYNYRGKNFPNRNTMKELENDADNLISFSKNNTIRRKQLIKKNCCKIDCCYERRKIIEFFCGISNTCRRKLPRWIGHFCAKIPFSMSMCIIMWRYMSFFVCFMKLTMINESLIFCLMSFCMMMVNHMLRHKNLFVKKSVDKLEVSFERFCVHIKSIACVQTTLWKE